MKRIYDGLTRLKLLQDYINIFDRLSLYILFVADCSGIAMNYDCYSCFSAHKHFQIPFRRTDITHNNGKPKFLQTTKTFRTMEQQVTTRSFSLSLSLYVSQLPSLKYQQETILQKSLCTQWSRRATNSRNKLSLFNQTCQSGKWNFEKATRSKTPPRSRPTIRKKSKTLELSQRFQPVCRNYFHASFLHLK